MNANSVWVGHEYAYVPIVRRGVLPTNAKRVKVLSLREKQQLHKSRKDTLATVEFVDSLRPNLEVNVRNLCDFWDSYQDELNAYRAEREHKERERRERYAREEAERFQEREAQRQAEKLRLQRIAQNLANTLSIDVSTIYINETTRRFSIDERHLRFLE